MTALSDTGKIRKQNEDAVFCDVASSLAILSDGMGGRNAGEIASHMVVNGLADRLAKTDFSGMPAADIASALKTAITGVHQDVLSASYSNSLWEGMGATLVMGLFTPGQVMLAHAGDSRCYCFRAGHLSQLTHDHSIFQEQVDLGMSLLEEAPWSPLHHLLTRALGVVNVVEPEFTMHNTAFDDIYLFCSDGLSNMLTEQEISRILRDNADYLETGAAKLVAVANANGGDDNISVILVKVGLSG